MCFSHVPGDKSVLRTSRKQLLAVPIIDAVAAHSNLSKVSVEMG